MIAKDNIHKILPESGLAREERTKKKQCTYVKYEREYSNTLWHADYTQLKDKRWLIVFIVDSSRFVVGYGVFDNATAENAITVLEQACLEHETPYSVMTDHGSQFYAMESRTKSRKEHIEFEKHLKKNNTRHILARVGHPQTNGKAKRRFRVQAQDQTL